jgi:AbrB family looped-hinge helix DNA binding protein
MWVVFGGIMAELVVDEKHRITLPGELRRHLGIKCGSRVEAEQRGREIVIRPLVPVRKPTEAIWGLARDATEANPKNRAREAIAKRRRLGRESLEVH